MAKKNREKKLTTRLKTRAGRSHSGRITIRHRGGGVKRLYRLVEFGQKKKDIPANIIGIEYDPYRTAGILLVQYEDGGKEYRLAPNNAKPGDSIITADKAEIKIGNRMRLKNIPIGTAVFNIELVPEQGGKIVRAAGGSAQVMGQAGKYMHIKMPSKELRKVHIDCFATIGRVSNPEHRFKKLPNAGRKRLMGIRPTVRGTAMQAGHPHAGGEGKTSIGLKHPKTPWGKIAHGGKTRRRKNTNKYIIKRKSKK